MSDISIQQLKQENNQLKAERKELFDKLKKLNEKLAESDAFKSHFLSNISNEIINPFTSILGISQNILQLKSSNISEIHTMAGLIYNEAFDLDFQLRNIFAAATIESGEIHLEAVPINLPSLLSEIIDLLKVKLNKNKLSIDLKTKFDTDIFIGDIEKLRLILLNLLMNALNFSEEKRPILIEINLSEQAFNFQINNAAKPISKEDAQRIFDRFTKLDNSINSLNMGLGLGLSIIKDYVEIMNGEINLESSVENGITFHLSLPPLTNKEELLLMDDEDLFGSDDTDLF